MKAINVILKKTGLVLAIVFACFAAVSQPSVLIHHIGVGQGDATLILVINKARQVCSILIDAGNSAKKGDAVYEVINQYLGTGPVKRIDFIITSHLHSDHLGGMKEVLTRLTADSFKIGYIIDRAAQYIVQADPECYDTTGNPGIISNDDAPLIPTSKVVSSYETYVNESVTKIDRVNVNTGLDLLNTWPFTKGFAPGIHFTSLTSGGLVCTNGMDYTSKIDLSANAKNENDYSYSFLFEMGEFRYFTGGDIGGGPPYVDLETPLTGFFNTRHDSAAFHFCTYKATHHGSTHSTNPAFVARTKPTVTVVPSALRSFSGTQLPGQETLDRITSSSGNNIIFYTYNWITNAYSGRVSDYIDVILKVDSTAFASNHQITIERILRDKTTLKTKGGIITSTFTCTKHGAVMGALLMKKTVRATGSAAPGSIKKYIKHRYYKKRKKLHRYKSTYHGKYA
jgi:competence protein ComEC